MLTQPYELGQSQMNECLEKKSIFSPFGGKDTNAEKSCSGYSIQWHNALRFRCSQCLFVTIYLLFLFICLDFYPTLSRIAGSFTQGCRRLL